MYRGQQAQPTPQAQAAQLLAGDGQEQVAYRGQQAQTAQLLDGDDWAGARAEARGCGGGG